MTPALIPGIGRLEAGGWKLERPQTQAQPEPCAVFGGDILGTTPQERQDWPWVDGLEAGDGTKGLSG